MNWLSRFMLANWSYVFDALFLTIALLCGVQFGESRVQKAWDAEKQKISQIEAKQEQHVADVQQSQSQITQEISHEFAKRSSLLADRQLDARIGGMRDIATASGGKAPNIGGSVLVIGDSKSPINQRQIASFTPGASTVEALDLGDLTGFARTFDPTNLESTKHLVEYAAELMTNLGGVELQRRLASLRSGTAKKEANAIEAACLTYSQSPSFGAAIILLEQLQDAPDVRVYRHEVLNVLKVALRTANEGVLSFYEATVQARERNRHLGRRISKISVGSTLLLKGLEADVSVILNPKDMDAKHLYVALTRGARKLVVCSSTSILTPAAKS